MLSPNSHCWTFDCALTSSLGGGVFLASVYFRDVVWWCFNIRGSTYSWLSMYRVVIEHIRMILPHQVAAPGDFLLVETFFELEAREHSQNVEIGVELSRIGDEMVSAAGVGKTGCV